jgi:hypothetical protein
MQLIKSARSIKGEMKACAYNERNDEFGTRTEDAQGISDPECESMRAGERSLDSKTNFGSSYDGAESCRWE